MADNVESFILANYDCRSTSNQGEYRTTCPFCGHAGMKFYFWFSIYAFKCYHCEEKGMLRKFFKLLHSGVDGLDYDSKDINIFQEEQEKKSIKLPADFKSFREHTDTIVAGSYVSYLLERGLSLKTIYNAGLGYSPTLSHYVIIPIRNLLGHQVYYTTLLTRRDLKKEKTYNPAFGTDFTSKGDVLFNLNHVARSNETWIVEGPMDALSFIELKLPVVALLGKSLSDAQARLLKVADYTTINICLDADALDSALHVADKLKAFCPQVNICLLPEGDPNDALLQNRLSEFVQYAIPYNYKTKMQIKLKLLTSKILSAKLR